MGDDREVDGEQTGQRDANRIELAVADQKRRVERGRKAAETDFEAAVHFRLRLGEDIGKREPERHRFHRDYPPSQQGEPIEITWLRAA